MAKPQSLLNNRNSQLHWWPRMPRRGTFDDSPLIVFPLREGSLILEVLLIYL